MKNLKKLEKTLGITFQNQKLLAQSLVHRSYLNENPESDLSSNERLEFLGDAVLSFIISDFLFSWFPSYQEDYLTNLRSRIVRTSSLAQIAKKLGLGNYLLLGRGEQESGGSKKTSLLADSLEALIGAIYLDQGSPAARAFIKREFTPLMKKLLKKPRVKDYKSTLQEKVQAEAKQSPVYKTIKTVGPPHAKVFTIAVYLKGKILGQGKGASKQEAEQRAAKAALEKWKKRLD